MSENRLEALIEGGGRPPLRDGGDEVEPVSLTIGTVVAALVLKGTEKAGEKVTEGSLAVLSRLVERVRRRFCEQGDHGAEAALARVQDPPAGPAHLTALAAAVDHHAGEDAKFAEELGRLVHDAESAGVDVGAAAQVAWGSQISQIQNMANSTIRVNIGQHRA